MISKVSFTGFNPPEIRPNIKNIAGAVEKALPEVSPKNPDTFIPGLFTFLGAFMIGGVCLRNCFWPPSPAELNPYVAIDKANKPISKKDALFEALKEVARLKAEAAEAAKAAASASAKAIHEIPVPRR